MTVLQGSLGFYRLCSGGAENPVGRAPDPSPRWGQGQPDCSVEHLHLTEMGKGIEGEQEVNSTSVDSPDNCCVFSLCFQMFLTVYLSNNEQHFTEVPVTPETICRDVVDLCKEPGESDCHLAEVWCGSGGRARHLVLWLWVFRCHWFWDVAGVMLILIQAVEEHVHQGRTFSIQPCCDIESLSCFCSTMKTPQ